MAHVVFISYAHQDQTIADSICGILECRGIRCWIAPHDIAPGCDWPPAITAAIRNSKVMVLVFSDSSNQSDEVFREVHQAVKRGVTIMPFKLEDVTLSDSLEYYLSTRHWVDALTPPIEQHIKRLGDAIDILIEPVAPLPQTELNRQPETYPITDKTLVNPASKTDIPQISETVKPSQVSSAANLPPHKINPKYGQKMILIPAGDFLMGDSDLSNNPRRTVNLDAYYIAETPVTVGQYEKFCLETTGHKMPPEPEYPARNKFNPGWRYKDHPIVNVKWQDAADYCAWAGMKLPTEAQWEKAACGTRGRKYPWGEDWDAGKCRCSRQQYGDSVGTAAVGSYPNGASPYGVLDMAGNVWEWCEDFYDENYFQTAPPKNPVNLSKSDSRAARGGSWDDFNARWFRAANRGRSDPGLLISLFTLTLLPFSLARSAKEFLKNRFF